VKTKNHKVFIANFSFSHFFHEENRSVFILYIFPLMTSIAGKFVMGISVGFFYWVVSAGMLRVWGRGNF
jgi:hypothetical protein